ncbi:MAG: CHAT domain-containing protein [Bryobacteraceae bacterium]
MKTKVSVCLLLVLPLAGPERKPRRLPGMESPGRTEVKALLRRCGEIYRATRVGDAAACYGEARRRAIALGFNDLAARCLANAGACYLASHQYQAALDSLQTALRMADAAGDPGTAGAACANISSVYEQMGELDSAVLWAERGAARIAGPDRAKHLPKIQIHLASLRARQGLLEEAWRRFGEGIDAADLAGDLATYALGWDRLGEELYKAHRPIAAERAMLEAYRVRKLNRIPGLEASYRNLGRVRLELGDNRGALALLNRAVESPGSGWMPAWDLYNARGRVHLAAGEPEEALADFRTAVKLVREWRAGVPAEDAARLSAEQMLEQAYSGLVRAAGLLYLRTGHPELAREAFEGAEENRASSLRAILAVPRMADLAGRTRAALGTGRAYIGFHLDEPESWRFAMDAGGLAITRLPGRARVAAEIERFRHDLEGAGLFTILFGGLPARIERRGTWLLALDDQLFAAPLAALQTGTGRLIERHAVQIVSGAGLLSATPQPAWETLLAGGFAGIGDPVYNAADPRWQGEKRRARAPWLGLTAFAGPSPAPDQLPRLVGTAREIELCGAEWGRAMLLRGAGASKLGLKSAIQARPAVLHLATHVLRSPARSRHGRIALSLSGQGSPELLEPSEIQGWGLEAGVVSLSGCSSGVAAALPGSGLLGLTRAWLGAGAASIVATLWPTPDDDGLLFRTFYRRLRLRPQDGPAAALRRAQLEMLASPGRWSHPRYWGAYFVVANR